MKQKKIICSVVLIVVSLSMQAKVKLPRIFDDNMVLQQHTQCNLWGKASANRTLMIKTSWDAKTYRVTVDGNGNWKGQVMTPSAGGPYAITFDDGVKTTLKNILIGEVWICSGQSNMEMPMKGFKGQPVAGATHELMYADDKELRLFTVKRAASLVPLDSVSGQWSIADAEAVREFSATAYFFGKSLRTSLKVPVGLIVTSWGGSACEAWMTKDWLKVFPQVKFPLSPQDVSKTQQRCPTALYNGMLHPLIGYTMRGVIWYQGEDNVSRANYYADLMSSMIKGWREEWKQGDFPFYYCQIAPYDYSLIDWHYNSAFLREQQAKVEQQVSNSRMAVLVDAGLRYGIHPRKKQDAGERLALLALANTYNVKGLPDFAAYSSVTFEHDTAVVSFDRSKEWVYFNHGTSSNLFEIAGSDRVFYPAEAWISRNHVYVKSDSVKMPVAVRYAFKDWVEGDLFHDGLPVSSFRTDNWDK